MTGSPLRACIVGLGWWGRQIVESIHGSETLAIVRAVESNIEDARGFAEAHDLSLGEDLGGALKDTTIDAVIIATPHLMHEQQVMLAAEAGKHVFCEKPLALDPSAARRMLDACRSRSLTLGVGHERRFEGALEDMADLIQTGSLGTLAHLECNWSHNLFMGRPASAWRQDPRQAPAGTMTALGVHITDLFQSLAGPVEDVRAVSSHRSSGFPSDDVITIQFRFAGGVTGVLTSIATTPFYSRITAFGDKAWVEVRNNSNVDVSEPALLTLRGLDLELHTRTFAHRDTVRENLDQWARAALGRASYRITDDQLVHNVAILDAIVRSARSGIVERVER